MSYLNGPRINFWGGGSTNVDTANNTEYSPEIFDLTNASVTSSQTDDEIIEYLRSPVSGYFANGGWNYYGDHQVQLMDNTVSSVGSPGSMETEGNLIGQGVYLLGGVDPNTGEGPYGGPVMVDLDPTSGQTTQIFAGGLQIGYPNPVLLVKGNSVSHSRFLGLRYDQNKTQPPYATPGSAYASGTFQLAFKKEDIASFDSSIQILNDIINAPNAQGIVVRFVMFQFYPGFSTDYMQENYADNRNDANPSMGRIIGSIGPWYNDEPATVAPGRLLNNQNLGGAQGLAHLDENKKILSLDLVSALEGAAIRQDGQANTGPIEPNVDYGNLQIGTAAGTLVETPSLPDDYYLYGGLYDIPLDSSAVDTLSSEAIVITSTQNDLSIIETPVRIYGDCRNTYVNETGENFSRVDLQIRDLGGPLSSDVTVDITSSKSGELPNNHFFDFPSQIQAATGATEIGFDITNIIGRDGFMSLNYAIDNNQVYFNSFRKYPEGNIEALLSADTISWDVVYEQCLRFFYVLFPAMSKRIPLNDETTIQAVSGEILKRISPEYRNTTLYMPLTRSLSPEKIALLKKYLEQ